MNKAIIIASIALSIVLGYQSAFAALTPADYTEPEISIEVPEDAIEEDVPQEEIPQDAEAVGYAYINSEMDIFITLPDDGWYFENSDYMTIFYNTNSAVGYDSIAFSSFINPTEETDRNTLVLSYNQDALTNFSIIMENIENYQTENFEFGEYSAYRFITMGYLSSVGDDTAGEYFYWWVDDRQYTCSLFCRADEFDYYSSLLHEALDSFQPASELG